MKAVLQNFGTGKLSVSEVPPPALSRGGVLVRNASSLVSAGTEKSVIELAKKNPLGKAKARPDLAKKVLNRAGQEGLLSTAQTVWNLVNRPIPLGYSCSGIVHAVGSGVSAYKSGDRVACAGLGHANHAEVIFSPENLTVKIPDQVSFEEAAFVTVGAIAMQSVRQAELKVGETVVVLGLGLVGQLVAQICVASGARVFGVDLDESKIKLAKDAGMQEGESFKSHDLLDKVRRFTRLRGADVVIIAAATSSDEPITIAAEMARDKAKVVVLGEVGMKIPRRPYYEKEIDIRMSRSYGPGRYDVAYEEKGQDYPIGYVRWTENRNMESFLDLVAEGKVNLKQLISHRFQIEKAEDAYALLMGKTKEPYLGILLDYDMTKDQPSAIRISSRKREEKELSVQSDKDIRFGIIGAGQFAQGILLPKLKSINHALISAIATGSGHTAKDVAKKYKAEFCTSDYLEITKSENIDAVLIATRHHQHAVMTMEALKSGKHVFVEKPLAINPEELKAVREVVAQNEKLILMVGYNRRFSPLALELRDAFPPGVPLMMDYRVNAGSVPADHWTQDEASGGGRIIGEVCHFVDVMQFMTRSQPVEVFAWPSGPDHQKKADADDIFIQLKFANGSIGSILYTASGDTSFSKEKLDVFGGGVAGSIDNWRKIDIHKEGKQFKSRKLISSQKGHSEELEAFVSGILRGVSPIEVESLLLTSITTFCIQESLRSNRPVAVRIEKDDES